MAHRIWLFSSILFLVCSVALLGEETKSSARILKVLPHLLDANGKHALSVMQILISASEQLEKQ